MTHAPDTLARPAEWGTTAVCAQKPYVRSNLWYADKGGTADRLLAMRLCRTCPVIDACRAVTAKEEAGKGLKHRHGIRAGMTPRQRWLAEQKSREQSEIRPACGTTKAYYQHLQASEPACDACQAASDAYEQALTPLEAPACGTRGGYQKHLRDHTEICAPCRQANTDADRRLRNTGTTKATTA